METKTYKVSVSDKTASFAVCLKKYNDFYDSVFDAIGGACGAYSNTEDYAEKSEEYEMLLLKLQKMIGKEMNELILRNLCLSEVDQLLI